MIGTVGVIRRNIIKFYKNQSIRKKLMWFLLLQVLIPLIILGFLSYQSSSYIINKNAKEYSKDILNMIRLRLDDYIRNMEAISDDLYTEQNTYGLLYSDYSNKKPIDYYDTQNKTVNLIRNIVVSREEIESICFLSSNGEYYESDSCISHIIIDTDLKSIADEKNGKPLWVYNKDKNLYLIRTINNLENYKKMGTMIIKLDKEYLSGLCSAMQKGVWNTAFISSDRQIIVESTVGNNRSLNEDIISQIDFDKRIKNINLDGMFIYYVQVPKTNWVLLSYVPSKILYQDATVLRNKIALFSLIVLLFLSVVNAYIALDIIQPINKLVKAMKNMREGETSVQIEVDRHDELGFLKKEFNKMSDRINYLLNSVYKQQLVNKQAQLKALQAQINPHFLFNTLESINWMAQLKNAPEISEVVSALSYIMEAGICRDIKPVTLKAEIDYVEKYILIMNKRFEDKLEFRKKLDIEAMNVRVPRLMIQPLIENAVYHGVENLRNKGIVLIKVYKKDASVIIEVIDNGTGINEDDLKELNQKLTHNKLKSSINDSERKSVGMENVNERIKLLYGEDYGIRVYSKENYYTRVCVEIPYVTHEK